MKKILVSMLAAFMVLAISGSAFAWSNGTLIASIYAGPNSTKEVGLKLGAVTATALNQVNIVVAQAGSISLADFNGKASSFADLKVGVFARGTSTTTRFFATTEDTNPGLGSTSSFSSNATNVAGYYDVTGVKAVMDMKAPEGEFVDSYWTLMNFSGESVGSYGGINKTQNYGIGEATLSANNYVDMYLYQFNSATPVTLNASVAYRAVLRFNTDGSVVLNPLNQNPVPVPGAFILLFSGLLGLVGIRRRA